MEATTPPAAAQVQRIDDRKPDIGDISIYVTPKGLEYLNQHGSKNPSRTTSRRFRMIKKRELFQVIPYCKTCGKGLTDAPHRPNSACMCNRALYCVKCVQAVRQGGWKRVTK